MSSVHEGQEEGGVGAGLVAAIPTILWQRRWLLIVPLVLTTIAGLVAAFVIHPVYQSSATVLIESQQLPEDLLGGLGGGPQVSDAIGQRVARARERVLSRMDLIRLIRSENLYPREQRTIPLSKIVDKMRADTTIAAVDSDIQIGSTNRRNLGLANTIAINVAFNYDDPVKAQIVAQQFVNHFLEADASVQASQAADTVNFLTEQANGLQQKIGAIESKVLQIKAENGTVLALGQMSGNGPADVSRIDSEIAGLQAEAAKISTGTKGKDDSGVAAAEAQLRVAQAKYSDTHPDVIAARAQVEAAKTAAAAAPGVDPGAAALAANRAQVASLERARAMITSRSSSLQSAQARAPLVAAEVDQLQKQADALREQYRGIGIKLQAAQIQARMESEQKGERLTLADPPVVPDHPLRPNRPMIIVASILAGGAIGLGLILLIELIFRPIRGTAALREALGEAPLAVIPDFDQKVSWLVRRLEKRTRRKYSRA